MEIPVIIGGAGPDVMDLGYLASRRVRICLQGHQPFAAAVQAVYDTLKALRDGSPPRQLVEDSSSELLNLLARQGDYQRWIDEFL